MSDYTLYHGDCLDYFGEIEPQSIDAVITDIPSGRTACAWDSVIPFEPMWAGIKRVLKPRGACVLLGCTQPFTSALVMSNVEQFKVEWVWRKNAASGFQNAHKQPMRNHESIIVFYGEQCTYNPVKQKSASDAAARAARGDKIRRRSGARNVHNLGTKMIDGVFNEFVFPTTVQDFDCVSRYHLIHDTQKPLSLLEYLVKTYTNAGDAVLDFTFGSGTTGHACANTGRRFVGIEKDKAYFDLGSERIATAYAPLRMMQAAI